MKGLAVTTPRPDRRITLAAALVLAVFVFSRSAPAGDSPGLLVKLYEIDPVAAVPELAPDQLPNIVKVAPVLDLSTERKEDFRGLESDFLTEVSGALVVEQAGTYVLRLLSDDGAKLWLDGRLVIDHDGLHGMEPKDSAPLDLAAGPHALRVWHFQGGGGGGLRLEWAATKLGSGGEGATERPEFAVVPAGVLRHDADASTATATGKKKIIPPLRRGLPGDGSPVTGMHPGYTAGGSQRFGGRSVLKGQWIVASKGLTGDSARLRIWVPDRADTSEDVAPAELPGGAYAGQHYVPTDVGECKRVVLDERGAIRQGAVFRFARVTADLLEPSGRTAFEMLAVTALSNGLEVVFTKPLDPRVGWDPESYYVEQWPFDIERGKPPRRDGVVYPVKSASVSADRKTVFIELENLRPSHVVYLRLLPPCLSADGERPWSTEAWYTLNAVPADRVGQVLPPPEPEPQNFLTAEEQAAGWRLLFDGRSSQGWRGWKKDKFPDGWHIKDGAIVRVAGGGDICTVEQYDDFELALEWRIAPAGNSGIFFRASEEFDWCWRTAPECQVLDNAEHADGRNPLTSAGSNYALHAPVRDVTQPVGLWNQVRIVARGPHVEHWLNGTKVVEYELGSPEWEQRVAASKFKDMPNYGRMRTGHIVLQDHGDRVWFRNIKLRPLAASP